MNCTRGPQGDPWEPWHLVGPAGLSGNESTTLEILHTDATLGALHALRSVSGMARMENIMNQNAILC